jgi:hypothetical protein
MATVSLSGTASICYEAGRNMMIGGQPRRKGELVPEANGWGSEMVEKLTRTGHLRVHIESDGEGVSEEEAPSLSNVKGRGRKDASQ